MEKTPYMHIPIHLTGFFQPYYTEDPLSTGSVGAGLILTPGIRLEIRQAERRAAKLNGAPVNIGPVNHVLQNLPPLEVDIESPLQPGVGFSLSAATTLGLTLLTSHLTGLTPLAAAQAAHVAEVKSMTGLGDVTAIYEGNGLAVRVKPGAPGIGEVLSLPVPKDVGVIASSLGYMDTGTMLVKYADKIRKYGGWAFKRFFKNPCFENFVETAEEFSKKVGFMNASIRETITPIRSKLMGAVVKKRVLFTIADINDILEVFTYLKQKLGSAYYFNISDAEWKRAIYQEAILGTSR